MAEQTGPAAQWLWFILNLLLWLAVIVAVLSIVLWGVAFRHAQRRRSKDHGAESDAGASLEERYKRGEISREDYERMKRESS